MNDPIQSSTQGTLRYLRSTTAVLAIMAVGITPTLAQSTTDDDVPLPELKVQGDAEGYKSDRSASPKYTAPLVDTPKSVTVIPEKVLQETGATSLTEALRTTPGITLGMGEGGTPFGDRTIIRGFSAESDTFIDGVRDPGAQSREIFALEQIEVTKGPGSAYTGAGATGGSLNLVSKTARLEDFYAGSATFGTDHTKRLTLDVNQSISDHAALRINGMWHDADVAGRDAVEVSRWGIAPSLSLGLGTDTRAILDYYHLNTDDIPDYGIPYARVRTGATTTVQTGEPAAVDYDNFYGLLNRDFRKNSTNIGTFRFEHDFTKSLTLRNVLRYGVTTNNYIVTNPDDSNGNVADGTVWRNVKSRNSRTDTFTEQVSLNGDFDTWGIAHDFSVGFEGTKYETKNNNYVVDTGANPGAGISRCSVYGLGAPYNCTSLYFPNPDDPWTGSITRNANTTTTEVQSWSFYGFDTMELDEQWSINFGLRYDDFTVSQLTAPTASGNDGQNRSNFVNYQSGIVYKPLPNASIYFSYGTSSNPSGETGGDGGSNLSSTNQSLDPERNKSYELGTKWDVLNDQLALTAAIFRTAKTNARVTGTSGTLELVGDQKVQGFEFTFAGNLTPEWGVFGGYTFLDSELVDDGTGTNDGNVFPNVAKNSFSLWSTYDIFKDVTVGGGTQYVSKVYGNTANTLWVPSYWRFDAMASYQVTQNVGLQLNVLNFTDKRYFDRAYTTHMATVAPGRSALFSMNVKF